MLLLLFADIMSDFTGLEKKEEEFKHEFIEGCFEEDPLAAVLVENSLKFCKETVKEESNEQDPLTIHKYGK